MDHLSPVWSHLTTIHPVRGEGIYLFDEAGRQYLALADSGQPVSYQALVAYAHMLYRRGDKEAARAFLGETTKTFSDNRYLLREGLRIVRGKQPAQDPTTPRGAASAIFHRLATEFSQNRSPQAAIVYLRVASYLTPEVAELYYMLGNLLEQSDNPEAAAQAYTAIPSISGLKSVADIRRIGALRTAERNDEAEYLVRTALQEQPDNPLLLTTLADMLREREDFKGAIQRYSQAIDLKQTHDQSDWFKYFARGICYEKLGRWDRAEQDLLTALQLNPNEASTLNYLGYSWIDRGKNVIQARQLIEKAVEVSPEDGFIIDSLGWVYYLTGEYEKAVELLERAVKLEPDDPTINEHLGDAYWKVGRKLEARFQWQHALDSKPEKQTIQTLLQKLDLGLS